MAEEYVCSLNDFFLKKAKDELHEDPKNRMGAVETFRNWIQSQKHLRCPTGNATPYTLNIYALEISL